MMKKTLHRYFSAITFGCLLVGSDLLAEQQFEFEATAPATFSFSIDKLSNVSVEVLEKPAQNYQPVFSIPTALKGDLYTGQFRLPPGTHEITVSENYRRNPGGRFAFQLHFSEATDPTEDSNDDIATPREIELGEEVEVVIFPRKDVDFVKLRVPEPGYLVVKALNSPNRFQLIADCTDEFGNALGRGTIRSDLDGEITIRISDEYGDFGSTEPVKILTEFHPESDHDEPNNTDAEALGLPLGEWREGLIAPLGDVDCFQIRVPRPGFVRYETKNAPNLTQKIQLISVKSGEPVGSGTHIRVGTPGDYIVRRSSLYRQMSLQPFLFRFTWHNDIKITPHDATEVTEIAPERRYGTSLGHGKDFDRLRVSVDELSIITFRAEGFQGLKFKRPDGGWIGNPGWIRTKEPVEMHLATQYGEWAADLIWVEANVNPEVDPTEPNDTVEDAFPLELESYNKFHHFPKGDQDWFRFEVPSAGEYQVSFYGEGVAGPNATLDFFDAERQSLGSRSVRSASSWSADPIELAKGIHFLRFQSSYGNAIVPPLHLAIHAVGQTPERPEEESATNTTGVHVVGVELGEDVRARLQSTVEKSGGSFVAANEAGEIAEKIDFVVEKIERESPQATEKKKRSWWWLLLLAAAAYFTYRWYRSRSRDRVAKEGSEEG